MGSGQLAASSLSAPDSLELLREVQQRDQHATYDCVEHDGEQVDEVAQSALEQVSRDRA